MMIAKISTGALLVIFACQCKTKSETEINYFGQNPPGTTAEVFAPGIVSTHAMEHSAPAFSPDGNLVLWTVLDTNYHACLVESRFDHGKWSTPQKPSFADSTADDYYPSFSVDGKKLYFSSRRKLPPGYSEPGDMRIWEVERNERGWGSPVPFDTIVTQGRDYAHSISKSGTLYYSSALGGGTNWNIRKSEKTDRGYSEPVLLPFNINSVDYEEGPYIAPDERFLIFESQRPEGINGSLDLYISFRNEVGQWSMPVNMGPTVNSGSAERFARLSPDGKYLFFGSTRNQTQSSRGFDIYWIDAKIIDELKNVETARLIIEQPLSDKVINALFKNDVNEASELLKKWLGLHPGSLDAILIYCSILLKQQKHSEAEQILSSHSSQWKNNTSFLIQMALVKFGLDRSEEASELLAPVLVEGDQLRQQYIYLSNALLDMGKLQKSDEYFEKAMAIFPASFPYFHRARALAGRGEKERAFMALDKAVALGGINNARDEFGNDPELRTLHSDPKWKLLLQKLEK